MNLRNFWSPLAAFACGTLSAACSDSNDGDSSYDASAQDAGTTNSTSSGNTTASSTTTGGRTSTSGRSDSTVDTIDASIDTSGSSQTNSTTGTSGADAGAVTIDAASTSDSDSAEAGSPEDTSEDGGTDDSGIVDPDAGVEDASTADAATEDAQVYIPDGGVVLRPTELPFDESYLQQLSLPDGFELQVFAAPGGRTRMLATYDDGVYVTRPEEGDVLRLEDTNDDGVADVTTTAVSGYPLVHGITFYNDTVYLATPTQLLRGNVNPKGSFGALETLIDDLPDGGQHPLRTLGVSPDGQLYLSVGSSCDACEESNEEHATLLQVALDGSSRTVFASGLRNMIGFDWHPESEQLWGMDNGSDWRGDELPPEELNLIEQGNDYGWPYCYAKQSLDPVIADPPSGTKAEYCATTTSSVLENQAHEAPIAMVFYDATAFPEEYRGNAFVAMHGSWNRIPATGYKIVRVVFEQGQPISIEDFVDGFLNDDGLATFGRPAGLAVDAAGALLFTDDSNGVVYRVSTE